MLIEVGTITDVLVVDSQIPEFDGHTTKQKIESKLKHKNHLILVVKIGHVPVAYKVGYELSNSEFYSWLGGVIPEHRQKGLATKLREYQENWAMNAGYTQISVKSMNRYPAMLQLLISSGYQINAYQNCGHISDSKICFIKKLTPKT